MAFESFMIVAFKLTWLNLPAF